MGQGAGGRGSVVVLVLLGLFLALAWCWQDIGFHDETIYLASARQVSLHQLWQGLETAPLYGYWYQLLALICPDPEWRYFLSWGLLVSLLMTLPLALRVPGAWVYALALVCLPVFRIWPYVSLFAALLLLIGLLVVRLRRLSVGWAIASAFTACFVAAFARSEYVYGVFCALLLFALLAPTRMAGLSRRSGWLLTLFMLVLTGLLVVIQQQSDSGRSGVAFAQHYNLRAAEQGLLGADNPWTSDYALKAFHIDPGHNAASTQAPLGAFLRADPARFFAHVLANVKDPRTLGLGLTVLLLTFWPWLRRDTALRPVAAYALLVSLPTLAASVLIYPRYHYAVTILPVLLLYAVELLRCERWLKLSHARWLLPLALLPMLVFALAPDLLARRAIPSRPGLTTIACLQTLERERVAGPGLMFDSVGHPMTYLQDDWRRVGEQDIEGWDAFLRWLATARPDWVLVTPTLAAHFQRTPAELAAGLTVTAGYRPHHCPAPAELTVYIRRD